MSPLWDHAVRVYSLPGMRDRLLALQDTHQMDVNAVLWILWLNAEGQTLNDEAVPEILRQTEGFARHVTQGLRRVRRYVSVPRPGFDDEALSRLRDGILKLEIASEELTLKRLDALTQNLTQPLGNGVDPAPAAERLFMLTRESMDRSAVIADEGGPDSALHLFRQAYAIAQDQGS